MPFFFEQLLMMGVGMMLQKRGIGQQQRGDRFGLLCRVVSPVFVDQTYSNPIHVPLPHTFWHQGERYGVQSGGLVM